jgi:voltage-gated potassium channel Kch
MSGLFFISIRRLRAPLVFLIVVLAVSTAGLALIPGVDASGAPWRLSLFDAFYFVTYTATTIGFGELPQNFTRLQRLWVTAIIYLSVVGWAYLLGSLLGLAQDKGFRAAVVAARFARAVRRLREPFYLLCGLGETGLRVARALDALGHRFVALDRDEAQILELDLGEFVGDPPALAADASSPETLTMAGLARPQCRGVLALMPDDRDNLAIAVAARLLHPGLRAIARAHTPEVMASMATAGVAEIMRRRATGSSAATAASASRWRARSARPASTSPSSIPTRGRGPGCASSAASAPTTNRSAAPASPRPKGSWRAATTTSPTWRWRWPRAGCARASS